jgi:hypothetical protein
MLYARYFHDVTGVSAIDEARTTEKGTNCWHFRNVNRRMTNNYRQRRFELDEESTNARAQRTGVTD